MIEEHWFIMKYGPNTPDDWDDETYEEYIDYIIPDSMDEPFEDDTYDEE